jgi:hypothetical protein
MVTAAGAIAPSIVEEWDSSSRVLDTCVNIHPYSIGIGSLEKQPGAKYGTNWAFMKIDGVDPVNEANTATGLYDYFCEATVQYKAGLLNASQLALIQKFVERAQGATALVGKPGVLAVPDFINNIPDFTYSAANPVSWQTKAGKMCALPVVVGP